MQSRDSYYFNSDLQLRTRRDIWIIYLNIMEPIIGSKWEALDEEHTWAKCTIRDICGESEYLVNFDGWGSRYDRRVTRAELRPETKPHSSTQSSNSDEVSNIRYCDIIFKCFKRTLTA